MSAITILAILSGLLQATGYLFYIRKSLTHEVDPNPATWFMFAYGTAVLAVLEWKNGATPVILILPIVCATLSIYLAFKIWQGGNLKRPDNTDLIAVVVDVLLTIINVGVWIAHRNGWVSESVQDSLLWVSLIASNLGTFTSFAPLVRNTWIDSTKEHWLPWTIWSSAYATLSLVTWLEQSSWVFLIYPVSNMFVHGFVGFLGRTKQQNNSSHKLTPSSHSQG